MDCKKYEENSVSSFHHHNNNTLFGLAILIHGGRQYKGIEHMFHMQGNPS